MDLSHEIHILQNILDNMKDDPLVKALDDIKMNTTLRMIETVILSLKSKQSNGKPEVEVEESPEEDESKRLTTFEEAKESFNETMEIIKTKTREACEKNSLIPMAEFTKKPHRTLFMTYFYDCPVCGENTPFKLSGVMTNTDKRGVPKTPMKILYNLAECLYCKKGELKVAVDHQS